jgi:hypothetical protein
VATINVELGANIRSWTTFTIKDATEEEIATLARMDTAAVGLLQRLEHTGRAEVTDTTYEDAPPVFDTVAAPDIIGITDEEGNLL